MGKYSLISSSRSCLSTTFQNLFVRNITLANAAFYSQIEPRCTGTNGTVFKLINATIQGLKQTNYKTSDAPLNAGLFMNIEGPTNFFIDNITVNNSILYSIKKLILILLIIM